MKTYTEILDLLKEDKSYYDEELSPDEYTYSEALDLLHDFADDLDNDEERDDSFHDVIRKEAQEIVDAFAEEGVTVDLESLLNDFYDEEGITVQDHLPESITTQMFGIDFLRDQFVDYKKALKELEKLIQKESEGNGKLKSIEFYAQKIDHRFKEKIDPRKLAALYRKKRALKECITEEKTISDDELQTLADLLDSTKSELSDDLLKAFISHNIKKISKIIYSEINDKNKAKKIITSIEAEMRE